MPWLKPCSIASSRVPSPVVMWSSTVRPSRQSDSKAIERYPSCSTRCRKYALRRRGNCSTPWVGSPIPSRAGLAGSDRRKAERSAFEVMASTVSLNRRLKLCSGMWGGGVVRPRLRPVDLARANRLSTQAVRNYEAAGILPPASRTETGYRVYTEAHGVALRAFLALVPAHGHPTATAIMQAVNRGAEGDAYGLIDDSHLQLMEDRQTLSAVELALRDLAPVGSA